MHTIEMNADIAASLATLREAVSTLAGFRAWFAEATVENRGLFTFTFPQPNETRAVTLRLDRADDRGVTLTCVEVENNPDWIGTTLVIDLVPLPDGKTRVHLAHSGYPSKNEVYDRCVEGWRYFLGSLTKYVTTGRGEPFPASLAAKVAS